MRGGGRHRWTLKAPHARQHAELQASCTYGKPPANPLLPQERTFYREPALQQRMLQRMLQRVLQERIQLGQGACSLVRVLVAWSGIQLGLGNLL